MSSAFDIRTQVMSLAIATLTTTTSPQRAASAADVLNGGDDAYAPAVAYPPAWVLAAQRRRVRAAAHAARYLNDAPTAASIWASTKRHAVRAALADSEYLDLDNRGTWLSDAATSLKLRKLLLRRERDHSPEIMVESLIEDLVRSHVSSSTVKTVLTHPELTAAQADRVLVASAGARHPTALAFLVSLRLGHVSDVDHPFMRCSYSISSALAETQRRYGDDAQDIFARHVAEHLPTFLTTISRPRRVDVGDVTALLAVVPAPGSAFPHPLEPAWCFTTPAVDLLLDAGWISVASLNVLTDIQFEHFLGRIDPSDPAQLHWLCRQATSPTRLMAILDILERSVVAPLDVTHVEPATWLRHVPDPPRDQIERVVHLLHLEEIYVTGQLMGELSPSPSPDFTTSLDLSSEDLTHLAGWLSGVELARQDHLLTYVPGLAGYVLYHQPRNQPAARVIHLLEASGLDDTGFAQACQLLADLPASLSQVIDATRAL